MLRPCIQLGAALALLYQLWSLLPALTAAVIFGNFYLYQTKVDHSILSDLVPVFLYLQIRYKDAWLLLFLTSFYFFTAGFSKLYGGWLAIDTQAVYSYVFAFEGMGRGGGFAPAALEGLPPLVWEGMDYVTVVWELAWALLLFRPRIALPLIAFGVLFHNATYALMGIGFWRMYLVYALLFYTLIFSKERYN